MKVLISITELMELGKWQEVCQMRGWNPAGVMMGVVDPSDEIKLTKEEAFFLGLLNN